MDQGKIIPISSKQDRPPTREELVERLTALFDEFTALSEDEELRPAPVFGADERSALFAFACKTMQDRGMPESAIIAFRLAILATESNDFVLGNLLTAAYGVGVLRTRREAKG